MFSRARPCPCKIVFSLSILFVFGGQIARATEVSESILTDGEYTCDEEIRGDAIESLTLRSGIASFDLSLSFPDPARRHWKEKIYDSRKSTATIHVNGKNFNSTELLHVDVGSASFHFSKDNPFSPNQSLSMGYSRLDQDSNKKLLAVSKRYDSIDVSVHVWSGAVIQEKYKFSHYKCKVKGAGPTLYTETVSPKHFACSMDDQTTFEFSTVVFKNPWLTRFYPEGYYDVTQPAYWQRLPFFKVLPDNSIIKKPLSVPNGIELNERNGERYLVITTNFVVPNTTTIELNEKDDFKKGKLTIKKSFDRDSVPEVHDVKCDVSPL